MSDARQALDAAREARAEQLAPAEFSNAKRFLDDATRQLEFGAYNEARSAALAAKQEAMRARDLAVGSGQEM